MRQLYFVRVVLAGLRPAQRGGRRRSKSGFGGRIIRLLEQRPDIGGIFASVERLALSSYQACYNLVIAIFKCLKIIGLSNIETASLLAPSLSAITQPAYAIGREAARLLLPAVTKRQPILPSQSMELKSELIARTSTKAE